MSGPYLTIIDADKIHDYVFSPQYLKLIRGGSAIQADLNEGQLIQILQDGFGPGNLDGHLRILNSPTLEINPSQRWELIYAGGGTVMALFRTCEDAELYLEQSFNSFRDRTGIATASSAVVSWSGDFPTTLENARNALECSKTARLECFFEGGSPYWKHCESCGLFPAAHAEHDPDGESWFACEACHLRLAAVKPAYLAEISRELKAQRDFESLAELSKPEGYLALVYIDVDRLGRYLNAHADSVPKFRQFSGQIRSTVREGVFRACRSLCREDQREAPFEVLLIGGDDAIAMVPAQMVFQFLEQFAAHFKNANENLPELTFSAGLVLAHQQFPIAQFLDHAGALLKSAKKKGGNTVDYAIISEAMAANLSERDPHTTKKPYSVDEFLHLRATLAEWKNAGVPATKAKRLYAVAHESEHQAILDYYFLLSRLSERHRDLLRNFIGSEIWQRAPSRNTAAADVAELWDFVEVA